MIKTERGRSTSVRLIDEELKLLQDELDKLSPEERKLVEDLIKSKTSVESDLYDSIAKLEWKREPVDMRTFILDDYYLGSTCDVTFPRLIDDLTEIFSGNYEEVIFSGSIGYGKTFAASIGICRVLYEISCMVNPQKSFGTAAGSGIAIVGMAVNEALAMKVVFENIATKIEASPYFNEHFPFARTKKELRFPSSVSVWARPTTDTGVLGLNAIAGIIDESNFLPTTTAAMKTAGQGVDKAELIYNQLKRRMKSRFQRAGSLPGKLFVVSSKFNQNDFTDRLIQRSKGESQVFVRDYALWDVHPSERFSTAKFHVLAGNDQIASKLLTPKEKEDLEKVPLPEGCSIVEVPEDFRGDFEKDLDGALRDLAGISVSSISPFISQRDKVLACIDSTKEHPFSTLSYDQSRGGTIIKQTLSKESIVRGASRWTPRWNPKAARHLHLDIALKQDCLGMAMAHIQRWVEVERRHPDGKPYREKAPFYGVDFLLQVTPPREGEIILGDIRRLIYEIKDLGFMITRVSADQYNSADTLQQLSAKGYRAEVQSVDIDPEPYDNLKLAFYEGRVQMYKYPPLLKELTNLEVKWNARGKRKIDHPKGPGSSKDISDALAGTFWTLLEAKSNSLPPPMLPSLPDIDYEHWMPEQRQVVSKPDDKNVIIMPFLMGDDYPKR